MLLFSNDITEIETVSKIEILQVAVSDFWLAQKLSLTWKRWRLLCHNVALHVVRTQMKT